jgi:hypothetical protein
MTALIWEESPLGKRHDRNAFDCDDDDLNVCLKRYARQNDESGGAKCFVATQREAPERNRFKGHDDDDGTKSATLPGLRRDDGTQGHE